jgi:hypothetical protein
MQQVIHVRNGVFFYAINQIYQGGEMAGLTDAGKNLMLNGTGFAANGLYAGLLDKESYNMACSSSRSDARSRLAEGIYQ